MKADDRPPVNIVHWSFDIMVLIASAEHDTNEFQRQSDAFAQALAQAGTQSWTGAGQSFFDFVASAKRRGICGLRRTHEEAGAEKRGSR